MERYFVSANFAIIIKTRSSATAEIVRVVLHEPYIYCRKLDFMGYISAADTMALASVNLTQLAPKAAVLCEIARNDDHWAVQSHSRSPTCTQIESPYATSY